MRFRRHRSYLNGERSDKGRWDYYPVVASYKVPIGIGVVLSIALCTIRQTPPHWAEWGLLMPMLAWSVCAGFQRQSWVPPFSTGVCFYADACESSSGRSQDAGCPRLPGLAWPLPESMLLHITLTIFAISIRQGASPTWRLPIVTLIGDRVLLKTGQGMARRSPAER